MSTSAHTATNKQTTEQAQQPHEHIAFECLHTQSDAFPLCSVRGDLLRTWISAQHLVRVVDAIDAMQLSELPRALHVAGTDPNDLFSTLQPADVLSSRRLGCDLQLQARTLRGHYLGLGQELERLHEVVRDSAATNDAPPVRALHCFNGAPPPEHGPENATDWFEKECEDTAATSAGARLCGGTSVKSGKSLLLGPQTSKITPVCRGMAEKAGRLLLAKPANTVCEEMGRIGTRRTRSIRRTATTRSVGSRTVRASS
jgi:hypothetical protein